MAYLDVLFAIFRRKIKIRLFDTWKVNIFRMNISATAARKHSELEIIFTDIRENSTNPWHELNIWIIENKILFADRDPNSYITQHANHFYCTFCGFTSIKKNSVHRHVESYHLRNEYPCHICYKIFRTKRNLVRHNRNMHGVSKLGTKTEQKQSKN